MADLNNVDQIAQLDAANIRDSIIQLANQCRQAWTEMQKLKIAKDYFAGCDRVVLCGMGASALGIDIVKSLYLDTLPTPIEIVRDYHIPAYVNNKTLVIISSYSGSTEEPLSCLAEAKNRGAKLFGIASGGKLAEIFQSANLPAYIFDPQYNPSNQPRMGLGYSIFAQFGLMARLGLIKLSQETVDGVFAVIDAKNQSLKIDIPQNSNPAKMIAGSLVGKIPVVVAAEHLSGNAHALANQIHENAKTLAAYFLLPEANHHFLEGLTHPQNADQTVAFVFLESNLYAAPLKKRLEITKKLVEKRGIAQLSFWAGSDDKVVQAFETLTFASWLSFYLAMANNIDPGPIPNVDFFKQEMAKTGT